MLRAGVEHVRGGYLDDLAEIHHPNPIAEVLHHGQVVGDEQVGQVELRPQVRQQIQDLRLD